MSELSLHLDDMTVDEAEAVMIIVKAMRASQVACAGVVCARMSHAGGLAVLAAASAINLQSTLHAAAERHDLDDLCDAAIREIERGRQRSRALRRARRGATGASH